MINPTLYKNVLSNIKWNAIESLFYSALMIAHQAALFNILDRSDYGFVGSIFSYIFFSELTLCLGLNSCAGTFFNIWSENQRGFRLFFGWNIAINYIASCLYLVIGYFTINFMSPSLYFFVACIIIFEQTKQICKTVMHILFKSRLKSFIELTSFATFLIMVWSAYLCQCSLNAYLLIVPFFITSLISCIFYAYFIFQWYITLPHSQTMVIDRPTIVRIIKNRLFSVTHKTSKRFFSSNFLVPMVATCFGMSQAGILKFTTQIAYYTTLVLRKSFGNASSALFAHIKNTPDESTALHTQWITTLLGYATGGIVGCAIIGSLGLHWYIPETFNFQLAMLTIACFCNAAITNSLTTFEQWFITHEKTVILIFAQMIITLCWLSVLMFTHIFSPLQLLIIATTCNTILFAFFGFIIFAYQKNKLVLFKNKNAIKIKI